MTATDWPLWALSNQDQRSIDAERAEWDHACTVAQRQWWARHPHNFEADGRWGTFCRLCGTQHGRGPL